jgi:hypothetical protein
MQHSPIDAYMAYNKTLSGNTTAGELAKPASVILRSVTLRYFPEADISEIEAQGIVPP